jgi:type II secretory pathway component PulM
VATRWSDLSPRSRRLILIGGAFEGLLKIAALVDLARRPRAEVRGSKARWAAAIVLTNSLGVVPVTYFVYGRHKA